MLLHLYVNALPTDCQIWSFSLMQANKMAAKEVEV